MDARCFAPVWLKDGKCPSDERHFRGATREVYSYLKLLAERHGGFVFASVGNIAKQSKKWRRNGEPYSRQHVKRIIRMFRALGILGKYDKRVIHGRTYRGWQFAKHDWWAASDGGVCEFKRWESYDSKHCKLMGNEKFAKQNEPDYEPTYEPDYEPENGKNEPENEPAQNEKILVVSTAETS